MQVQAYSGQIVSVTFAANAGEAVAIDVDCPLLAVQFTGASGSENYCILSASRVLQMDGSYASTIQFRIPFGEQGINGEIDVEGVTSIDFVSEVTITGTVSYSHVEVI
tara:strand:- start:2338 stop:2661 length:324 start_codon:yes stop_codon:yes gene_type:complete